MKAGRYLPPRLLTKRAAALYCGVSASVFSALCPVRPISLGKGRRLERYDVRSLDTWIDGLGGEASDGNWLAKLDAVYDGST